MLENRGSFHLLDIVIAALPVTSDRFDDVVNVIKQDN